MPDWDRDVAFGEHMELVVEGVLSRVRNGGYTQETKGDRHANGRMFLEWEHDPGRRDSWKPSGLQTTKADLFVYAHGTACFEVWDTVVLKAFVLWTLKDSPRRLVVGGGLGDCPTRGVITTKYDVLRWHGRSS